MNAPQPRRARTASGCPATVFASPAETCPACLPQRIPRRLPPMPEAKVPRRGHPKGPGYPASNTHEDPPAAQTLLFRLAALGRRQQPTLPVLAKLPLGTCP
jgi:hypothetical protein